MQKNERLAIRALLTGWAKYKLGAVSYETKYQSPPNVIARLMENDIVDGGHGVGSTIPRGVGESWFGCPHVYVMLDNVIESLPKRRKEVIYREFLTGGGQKEKAEAMVVCLREYEILLNYSLKQLLKDNYVKNLLKRLD